MAEVDDSQRADELRRLVHQLNLAITDAVGAGLKVEVMNEPVTYSSGREYPQFEISVYRKL